MVGHRIGQELTLALGLREVVYQELAPCHEYIFEMRSKVVLLYGATERVIAHGICNINVFARHVLLGFPRGTDLDDPARTCDLGAHCVSFSRCVRVPLTF